MEDVPLEGVSRDNDKDLVVGWQPLTFECITSIITLSTRQLIIVSKCDNLCTRRKLILEYILCAVRATHCTSEAIALDRERV